MQHSFSPRAALFPAALLALTLAACGDSTPDPAKTVSTIPKPDLTKVVSWKDHAFADKAFLIKVPGDPICQELHAGSLGANLCTTDTERSGLMYSYTKLRAAPGKMAGLLAGTMEGSAKDLNGNVVNSADITANGLKGKEYTIKNPEGEYRARIFITPNYLVQIMGTAKVDPTVAKGEIDLYLNSLTAAASK